MLYIIIVYVEEMSVWSLLLTGYRFPVGDGEMYGGVLNAPLEKGSGYDVYYGVDVRVEVSFKPMQSCQ